MDSLGIDIGSRYSRDLIDESADVAGLLARLTERYIQIGCSCFTPNYEY